MGLRMDGVGCWGREMRMRRLCYRRAGGMSGRRGGTDGVLGEGEGVEFVSDTEDKHLSLNAFYHFYPK